MRGNMHPGRIQILRRRSADPLPAGLPRVERLRSREALGEAAGPAGGLRPSPVWTLPGVHTRGSAARGVACGASCASRLRAARQSARTKERRATDSTALTPVAKPLAEAGPFAFLAGPTIQGAAKEHRSAPRRVFARPRKHLINYETEGT